MLKKILKVLAVVALIAVLSFAIIAIYSYSTIEIMRKGLDTITGKDVNTFFEHSKEEPISSQMRLIWVDKNLGKAAILLEAISERERLSIFPSLNARNDFALSCGGESLNLSNPNLAVPFFFVKGDLSESFGDGLLLEFVCVIFDIPQGKSGLLLKIMNSGADVSGNFQGCNLHFKNSPTEVKLAKDRSFFGDLILRTYFNLNASESSSVVSFISNTWEDCDAKKATKLSLGLQMKYYEFLFGASY